ncbi:hypothetical protein [Clostridium sp. YIM B02569]|uniref:hypothetical protein n=1 Tax=Clostridium sp. YIM B02569 TaxID=2911967 RepID=UPI001EED0D9A|nr:hypothetical protein [Clostridium sp. YIM B02569]
MEMSYDETQKKLEEVYKVAYAYEKVIEAAKGINESRYNREPIPYLHIPIADLRKLVSELNAKIEDLKSKAVVTYKEDTSYIDILL